MIWERVKEPGDLDFYRSTATKRAGSSAGAFFTSRDFQYKNNANCREMR